MSAPVTFRASLPPIQSAIRMGQDSWRVQLDIPHSDIGAAAGLLALFGQVFHVTVVAAEDDIPHGAPESAPLVKRGPAKRRNRAGDPSL